MGSGICSCLLSFEEEPFYGRITGSPFQMRQSGMAYGKIAAVLNEKGILPPRWYWAVHYGNGSCKYSRLWAYATVRSLLNDDVYAGTLTDTLPQAIYPCAVPAGARERTA